MAAERILAIKQAALALGRAPHQGQSRAELSPAVRSVTKDRAVFYFSLEEETETLSILAIFYGGQDHQRAMLRRALEQEP